MFAIVSNLKNFNKGKAKLAFKIKAISEPYSTHGTIVRTAENSLLLGTNCAKGMKDAQAIAKRQHNILMRRQGHYLHMVK